MDANSDKKIKRSAVIARRLYELKQAQECYRSVWVDLSSKVLCREGSFYNSDKGKAPRINTKVINNTAYLSSRTLASGLMVGVSPQANQWVNFIVNDPVVMEDVGVRAWLGGVEKIVSGILNAGQIYNKLYNVYEGVSVFGTGAIGIFDDEKNIIRCESYEIGTYYIDTDGYDVVNTFYREISFTASDLVGRFGKDNVPKSVIEAYERKNHTSKFNVIHAIEPNKDYDEDSKFSKHMKFSSTYVLGRESSSTDNSPELGNSLHLLSQSGFSEFPIMCPRWSVSPRDVYGTGCPGMLSIGDVNMLQLAESMKYRAMEKDIDPPTVSSGGAGSVPIGALDPGKNIQVNDTNSTIKRIYEPRIDLSVISNDILKIENRIKRAFYEDKMTQMLLSDRREMTKAEVEVRTNEALKDLSPVFTRFRNELLDPLVDRVFNIALRKGFIPEAPEAIQGQDLSVEYVSTLAKAQKEDDSVAIQMSVRFMGELATLSPNAIDSLNVGSAYKRYCNAVGVPSDLVRSSEELAILEAQRQEEAQAQQEQQQLMEMASQAPGVAKAVGEIQNIQAKEGQI